MNVESLPWEAFFLASGMPKSKQSMSLHFCKTTPYGCDIGMCEKYFYALEKECLGPLFVLENRNGRKRKTTLM
jgi:hypothetical protein